jgi:hypothetical protein
MNPLQELIEVDAIQRLKTHYLYFLDNKNWEDWLSLFTQDATLQTDDAVSTRGRDGRPGPKHEGIDAIAEFVIDRLKRAVSVHYGHTPWIDVISDTEARGIWAMESTIEDANELVHSYGHYRETYRKEQGEWKISSLHLTRVRLSITKKRNLVAAA